MNGRRSGDTIRTLVDLAYSAAALGLIAYTVRGEIRAALTRQRNAFNARRAEVTAEADRIRKGRDYLATIRDRIIAEEHDADPETGPTLGMEP